MCDAQVYVETGMPLTKTAKRPSGGANCLYIPTCLADILPALGYGSLKQHTDC
jgi:hypothetical protein